jgi:uncharacterized protein with HEPN domain
MDNKVSAWLEDILRSIDEISDFLPEKRDFFEFQKDLKTKKAIERNIEIIGEAVNRITNYKNFEIKIQNARQIRLSEQETELLTNMIIFQTRLFGQ